jgi:hypothetical protein
MPDIVGSEGRLFSQVTPAERDRVQAAMQGPCQEYASQAFGDTAAHNQEFLDSLTRFTACLRENGADIPDPDPAAPFQLDRHPYRGRVAGDLELGAGDHERGRRRLDRAVPATARRTHRKRPRARTVDRRVDRTGTRRTAGDPVTRARRTPDLDRAAGRAGRRDTSNRQPLGPSYAVSRRVNATQPAAAAPTT